MRKHVYVIKCEYGTVCIHICTYKCIYGCVCARVSLLAFISHARTTYDVRTNERVHDLPLIIKRTRDNRLRNTAAHVVS